MTQDTTGHLAEDTESSTAPRKRSLDQQDLLRGLWERAAFPRLPSDAPTEFRELVREVEDPRKVYAVHVASRRHGFQLWVAVFVVQLRDGCGTDDCPTPTCFSYRRRHIGRGPIRKYTTTSARALAVLMASQPDAETALCPHLSPPRRPSSTSTSLKFVAKPVHQGSRSGKSASPRRGSSNNEEVSRPVKVADKKEEHGHKSSRRQDMVPVGAHDQNTESGRSAPDAARVRVVDENVAKDHRSFAANVFGTTAFRMLEWLTPLSLRYMRGQTEATLQAASTKLQDVQPSSPQHHVDKTASSVHTNDRSPVEAGAPDNEEATFVSGITTELPDTAVSKASPVSKTDALASDPEPDTRTTAKHGRHASHAKIVTSPVGKLHRQLSFEAVQTSLLQNKRTAPAHHGEPDGKLKHQRLSSRPLSGHAIGDDASAELLGDDDSHKHDLLVKQPEIPLDTSPVPAELNVPVNTSTNLRDERDSTSRHSSLDRRKSTRHYTDDYHRVYAPETLTRLDRNVIDCICDILQRDKTGEQHVFEPQIIDSTLASSMDIKSDRIRLLKSGTTMHSAILRQDWKLFVEQSIFYIFSSFTTLRDTFTHGHQPIDSFKMWYYLLRLTRVMPSIVCHSLWLATGQLFVLPRSLLDSQSSKMLRKVSKSKYLDDNAAACLISIGLHTLIALAPLVNDVTDLTDVSRVRALGLISSFVTGPTYGKSITELCLQYDDAFSNDLVMRLALRVFSSLVTRRAMHECTLSEVAVSEHDAPTTDVIELVLCHLDALVAEGKRNPEYAADLQTTHAQRMPVLLLDWARAIMVQEWTGDPVIPMNGAMGGALLLIEAIHKRRQAWSVADCKFRAEYFGNRLDVVEMPMAWLNFTSSKTKMHLLDLPYIFDTAARLSYFRAINFSRMGNAFELASSLKLRMDRLAQGGSLTMSAVDKFWLQDRMQSRCVKYLVLDIRREDILKSAFDQLWHRQEMELLRPLKIHLGEDSGEEGIDSGGVQQEFFRLAFAEAMDPRLGMFTVDERTRMAWFKPSLVEEWRYEIVGLLVSLALFNGLTLPITFPKALYNRLLGEPVTELHHIEDGWPDLANGLNTLLEWDESNGLVEDVFARTYEFAIDLVGENVSREMKSATEAEWPQLHDRKGALKRNIKDLSASNPLSAPDVTCDNRHAYVADYIRYLTDVSIRPQFTAFERGFRACLHPKSLKLLSPSLLQCLTEGEQEIDINELRRTVRYVGWDASHHTVKDFWHVVRKFDDGMKRKLLEFVTASDRVPAGGVKNIQFVVQRNGEELGEDIAHLPTAYTCYGTLLLPEYKDREALRERLCMALENAQGFGFG